MSSLADMSWILNKKVTGWFAKVLEDQLLKLKSMPMSSFCFQLHQVNDIITTVYNGKHKEYLWLSCTTCAEQLLCSLVFDYIAAMH